MGVTGFCIGDRSSILRCIVIVIIIIGTRDIHEIPKHSYMDYKISSVQESKTSVIKFWSINRLWSPLMKVLHIKNNWSWSLHDPWQSLWRPQCRRNHYSGSPSSKATKQWPVDGVLKAGGWSTMERPGKAQPVPGRAELRNSPGPYQCPRCQNPKQARQFPRVRWWWDKLPELDLHAKTPQQPNPSLPGYQPFKAISISHGQYTGHTEGSQWECNSYMVVSLNFFFKKAIKQLSWASRAQPAVQAL